MKADTVAVFTDTKIRDYKDEQLIFQIVKNTLENYLSMQYSSSEISDLIHSGETVLIKPNIVHELNFLVRFDKRQMDRPNDCFITNWNVIKAVVKVISVIDNLKIIILECPLQSCSIEKIVTPEKLEELRSYNKSNYIEFVDGRRTKYLFKDKEPQIIHECRSKELYVDFDLKENSLHNDYKKNISRFRVTDYPPNEMKKFHNKQHHKYRVAKEVIEADCVINIPKLKTHMKSGMTGAMKNFVGVVGNKECLPHHTKGSVLCGGDCYGDMSLIKPLAESIMDIANSYMLKNEKIYYYLRKVAMSFLYMRAILGLDYDISGSWYGNDTICRTIVDLNRIVYFGGRDGKLYENQQRRVISIIDGLISGMGEGPMKPIPNYTGFLCVSESTAAADAIAAEYLGIDSYKLRFLAKNRINDKKFPLSVPYEKVRINYNGKMVNFSEFRKRESNIIVAPRWIGKIEKDPYNEFLYFNQFFENIKHYRQYIKDLFTR